MDVKNKIFTSISSFIHAVEELELNLNRGQHETAFLASNILRRALDLGLDPSIRVSVEFKLTGSRRPIDFVLFGENSTNNQLRVFVLEFKQWSEITHLGNTTFESQMYGEKDTEFDFNVGKCPYKQTCDYTNLVGGVLGKNNVRSGLVFPNMKPEGMPIEFANAIALDPEKVNCFVKSRIDGLCFEIIGFLSKGVSQSHSTINQYATVTNLNQHASYNGTSSTPIFGTQPNERHGWVGTVEEFLKACLDNSLIDEFEHENISMRRSIQFSTNHLAVSLRKLSVLSASLVDHMVVIIEFRVGIGGKRVDAVLAINTGDTSTPLAMYAIEMKAWSPAFKHTFEMIEQSIGNDLFPSSVRYKAKKGRAYQSPNPVMQVRGYIQDLQFEFGSKVHGCAWLHNIQDRLSTPFDKLAIQKHITMAKISIGTKIKPITCYDLDGIPIALHTKLAKYSPDLATSSTPKRVYEQLHFSIMDFFSKHNPDHFDSNTLKLLCNSNPIIGKKPITEAFQNSNGILKNILDREQKRIAKHIIEKTKLGIIKRSEGMSPTKTVFAINGDAGTGKTFIALASIGQILNFMAENEDSLLHAVSSPKLVCLNNSAADLISKTCRSPLAKSKKFNINANFILSRQQFNSNSQYFLTSLLVQQWRCESDTSRGAPKPPLLIFDEAQLQSEFSDAGNMKALVSEALRTHGVEDFETEDFKQWLRDKGFIFIDHNGQETSSIRTDLEHLSDLADVTVFFYDSKQGTRSAAIRNLDSTSFSSLQADARIKSHKYELTKSYRSDQHFLRMVKEILYGENLSRWHPRMLLSKIWEKIKKPKKKITLYKNENEFIESFTQKITDEPSTGLVAGYTKFWKSRGAETFGASNADWHLGGRYFHWNKSPGRLWIMSNGERQNHIGYFLAVQGNELDHIFVYIGNDVKVDSVKYKLVADVANHQSDSECVKSNRARVTDKEDCILNQYWVLMTRWRESCSIYCENDQVRQLFEEKLEKFGI